MYLCAGRKHSRSSRFISKQALTSTLPGVTTFKLNTPPYIITALMGSFGIGAAYSVNLAMYTIFRCLIGLLVEPAYDSCAMLSK